MDQAWHQRFARWSRVLASSNQCCVFADSYRRPASVCAGFVALHLMALVGCIGRLTSYDAKHGRLLGLACQLECQGEDSWSLVLVLSCLSPLRYWTRRGSSSWVFNLVDSCACWAVLCAVLTLGACTDIMHSKMHSDSQPRP